MPGERSESARSSARFPSSDPGLVPARPVLLVEQDQRPVRRRPRVAPGVVEEHQRQQPERLRLVRHQDGEQLGEPDRLLAEVCAQVPLATARRVALVEDEVEDGQHGAEPLGEEVVGRDAKRDPGRPDLPLGAHEALGHRRLRDQERVRDLRRRQAYDLAQGQRHPRVRGERRMTAGEDEREPVVGDRAHALVVHRQRFETGEQLRLPGEDAVTPDPVDCAVARGRDHPGAGVGGRPVARPAFERGGERILHRVLGEGEVAEDTGEDRDGTAPFLAEDATDVVGQCSTTGLSSTDP